ncbi:hypothetical protein PRNP1_014498 [Phytophthora ramorum]
MKALPHHDDIHETIDEFLTNLGLKTKAILLKVTDEMMLAKLSAITSSDAQSAEADENDAMLVRKLELLVVLTIKPQTT